MPVCWRATRWSTCAPLPVKERNGHLIGTVGLRELAGAGDHVGHHVSQAATAFATEPALGLLPVMTDSKTHAVIVTDNDRRIIGLISQTDLLSAVARALPKIAA